MVDLSNSDAPRFMAPGTPPGSTIASQTSSATSSSFASGTTLSPCCNTTVLRASTLATVTSILARRSTSTSAQNSISSLPSATGSRAFIKRRLRNRTLIENSNLKPYWVGLRHSYPSILGCATLQNQVLNKGARSLGPTYDHVHWHAETH